MELGPLVLFGLGLARQQFVDPVPAFAAPPHHHVLPLHLGFEAKKQRSLLAHVLAQFFETSRNIDGRLQLNVGFGPTWPGLLVVGPVNVGHDFLAQVEEESVVDSSVALRYFVVVFAELADLVGYFEVRDVVARLFAIVNEARGFFGECRELVEIRGDDCRRWRGRALGRWSATGARWCVRGWWFVGDFTDVVGYFFGFELLYLLEATKIELGVITLYQNYTFIIYTCLL